MNKERAAIEASPLQGRCNYQHPGEELRLRLRAASCGQVHSRKAVHVMAEETEVGSPERAAQSGQPKVAARQDFLQRVIAF